LDIELTREEIRNLENTYELWDKDTGQSYGMFQGSLNDIYERISSKGDEVLDELKATNQWVAYLKQFRSA
jgi:hypothetical protein